jgi:lipoate-protein ligase A
MEAAAPQPVRLAEPYPWRALPFSTEPMGRQLALAEGMLAGVAETGVPAWRWYVPEEPALVLGNGQSPSILNLTACQERGVRPYRRTSGGTAVVVDAGLLSLDVALPAAHPLNTSDIVRAYQWMGALWERALRELGAVKVRALPTEEVRAIPPLAKDDPLRLACYGTLSPWEVVVGKRKLVGLCQVRRKAGALYQVGIYQRFDPKALGALLDLNNNRRKVLGTRLHNAAVGLDVAAGRAFTREEVIAAVETALTAEFGARLAPATWRRTELATADRLQRERFQPLG